MLGIENRTSAHARVQHCCTKLAKRLQHPQVLHEKFEPTTPNMSQHITTLWPNAHMLHPTMLRYVAMTCWDDMLGSFGRDFTKQKVLRPRPNHRNTSTQHWPPCCDVLRHTECMLVQQHPTCRNRVAKRAQNVAPNNVAICRVGMLGSS